MDQSTEKPVMDPLDQRINTETHLEQQKKWVDMLRIASVTPKGKDPVFATSVVWLIEHGYIPKMTEFIGITGARCCCPGPGTRETSTNQPTIGRIWA